MESNRRVLVKVVFLQLGGFDHLRMMPRPVSPVTNNSIQGLSNEVSFVFEFLREGGGPNVLLKTCCMKIYVH